MRFPLPSTKCSAAPSPLSTVETTAKECSAVVGGRGGGEGVGAAEHLIDGSENRIYRLSIVF